MIELKEEIRNFLNCYSDAERISNESDLQSELLVWLRNKFGRNYIIRSEYYHKNEKGYDKLDIYIERRNDKNEKYCIEIKVPPSKRASDIPEFMQECVQDLHFVDELKTKEYTKTCCMFLATEDNYKAYFEPKISNRGRSRTCNIYDYFQGGKEFVKDKPITYTVQGNEYSYTPSKDIDLKGNDNIIEFDNLGLKGYIVEF